ncbi:hypothetical protein [Polluticoccus soli]|uniref:hypothetical protein n=1 Tax=Polluticoccus soli TaxID=3034150 RepID=UPI0023E30C54|nr:hypothetical protein [Flavipsychrobacter sp. JY13-12]
MKHILFATTMLLAIGAQAQKLEVGGNFGIANTIDRNAGGTQLYYSLKGIYNVCNGLQVGISGNLTHLPFEAVITSEIYSGSIPPITPVFDIAYIPGTELVHNVKAFANVKRDVGFGALTVYSGLSAGIMSTMPTDKPRSNLANGYTLGAQAGATYNVTKRFGVNAELAADYINMKANGSDFGREAGKNNLTTINMPLTIGFRYKLSCPCPKSCPLSRDNKDSK